MGDLGYARHIRELMRSWPAGKPITSADAAASLACAFGIGLESAKKIANVNMKRLADRGDLARIQKSVYGIAAETPFGKIAPRPEEVVAGILLRDGDKPVGHLAGPSLLNALGLSSQMPADLHIATNLYRRRLPKGARIRASRPILEIDSGNVAYLQVLEAFAALERCPIDAGQPEAILCGMLQAAHISNEKLVLLARQHCSQKTLLKVIDIALGGMRHEPSR
ncbi:MAG: hypothetical protein LBC69_01505 [Eubacteriaceae bacterium]|nr:hypothetical protein [Eubacteriaceae bacterium]